MKTTLIVFDMDGVLVDVSRSYRDVVRQTARLFFKDAAAWKDLPQPLCTLSDIARVKQRRGLNNDWDLTCRVISLLMTLVDTAGGQPHLESEPWSMYEEMVSQWDVSQLGKYLKETDSALWQLVANSDTALHPFIQRLYQGDIGRGNIIKQIFQEIYLGKDLFESTYPVAAKRYHGEGYIKRETLLVSRSELKLFSRENLLAIATGRPRMEAEFSLNRFQIADLFSAVYTLDDCLKEEQKRHARGEPKITLSKPNPFMLDALAAQLKDDNGKCYYIGDMPDDMLAASRANTPFEGIGLLLSAPEKDRLREGMRQAGAKHIIDSFQELEYLLKPDTRRDPKGEALRDLIPKERISEG